MNIPTVKLESIRFYRGGQVGLNSQTALCILNLRDDPPISGELSDNLQRLMMELTRGDPFFGLTTRDWPGAFLASTSPRGNLSEWIVAIVITLQRLVGDWSFKGQVVGRSGDQVQLALPWTRRTVLESAVTMTLDFIFRLKGEADTARAEFLTACSPWVDKYMPEGLSPATLRFAHAAAARGWPVMARPGGLVQLGWGQNAISMLGCFTSRTGNLATRFARVKVFTKELLSEACLPVPRGALLWSEQRLEQTLEKLGWPLVVKPNSLDQGAGVVANITSKKSLQKAFEAAQKSSRDGVIVEHHVQGDDHRLLVVGGRLMMATKRVNGGVTGDGKGTIEELVEEENRNPLRGTHKRSIMIRLALDDEAQDYLEEQGLGPLSIPKRGTFVPLRRTANISTGGTAVDVTATIHPDNRVMAERAARVVGLDIAGVDFICPDISSSWKEVGGAICEVNAQPGLRPHWLSAPARDINGEILDWLCPDGALRIPVTMVAGGGMAAEIAELVYRIWLSRGEICGLATVGGVWIGGDKITNGPRTNFDYSRTVLVEPTVGAAVMAMDYRELQQSGHPCDRYTVVALPPEAEGTTTRITPQATHAREVQRKALLARAGAVVLDAREKIAGKLLAHAPNTRVVLVVTKGDIKDLMRAHGALVREMVSFQEKDGSGRLLYWNRGEVQQILSLPLAGGLDSRKSHGAKLITMFAVATALAQGLAVEKIRDTLSHGNLAEAIG